MLSALPKFGTMCRARRGCGSELNAGPCPEHIEVGQRHRDLSQFSGFREEPILIEARHESDLRFDMLIGHIEVHGCGVDRLIHCQIPLCRLRTRDLGRHIDTGDELSRTRRRVEGIYPTIPNRPTGVVAVARKAADTVEILGIAAPERGFAKIDPGTVNTARNIPVSQPIVPLSSSSEVLNAGQMKRPVGL
jgi:hypothetical protein